MENKTQWQLPWTGRLHDRKDVRNNQLDHELVRLLDLLAQVKELLDNGIKIHPDSPIHDRINDHLTQFKPTT